MAAKPNQLTPLPEGFKVTKVPPNEDRGAYFFIDAATRFMQRENHGRGWRRHGRNGKLGVEEEK